MNDFSLIGPVVTLVVWTLVIQTWMFWTRFRALGELGISLRNRRGGSSRNAMEGLFPNAVNWKAHNYANLMEQPTIFYAIIFALTVLGTQSTLSIWLAWIYSGSRIAHSLIQTTANIVTHRLAAFIAGSLCLAGLAGQAAMQLIFS